MRIDIFGVGNRQMNKTDRGDYITLIDFFDFISWLEDDDNPDVILQKISDTRDNIKERKENKS